MHRKEPSQDEVFSELKDLGDTGLNHVPMSDEETQGFDNPGSYDAPIFDGYIEPFNPVPLTQPAENYGNIFEEDAAENAQSEKELDKDVCFNPVTRPVGEITPPEPRIRDAGPKEEEEQGILEFKIYHNDGSKENLKALVRLKDIFSKQLPKMPVEYITRLVFDRKHQALAMIREGIIIGGIQFRAFSERNFIEIVFCAVTQSKQVRGYGSYLMNHLKAYTQSQKIYNFLTYADNYAVGYFKKQGFSKEIDLDRSLWGGVVKDYDGGTLMQCSVMENIDYMQVPYIIYQQRVAMMTHLKELSSQHIIWEGFREFKKGYKRIALEKLEPLLEMGWNPASYCHLMSPGVQRAIKDHNRMLLNSMKEDKFSWPFLEPVDGSQVPDYYSTILDPIDLQTIGKRLNNNYYITQEMIIADIQRMVDNCKRYNGPNNEYYSCAVQLENKLKRWKTISVDLK